jgi:integrase
MREKLTNAFAQTVTPTPGKVERYFDTDKRSPRGFLLRVSIAGTKTWALNYRTQDTRRQRELTIGDVRSWRIAEARHRGHELRREIDAGGDPLGEREERRDAPTVADLVERFIAEALPSRAPRTQAEYQAMLRDWIRPTLGNRKVEDVTREDIERLHRKITAAGSSRRANAVKSLASTLFSQAIVWRMRRDNPTKGVRGNAEVGRERYLSAEETERLVAVLTRWRAKRPDSVDITMLAILTGARRGEILGMRWADVDLSGGVWSKPPGSTKQRLLHRTPLSNDAVAVLRRRRDERAGGGKVIRLDDHVFSGGGKKAASNRFEDHWREFRAEAGLTDVRFHDLRHSYASTLVSAGLSLPVIGRMLGHSKPQTTLRYAHLADDPLRAAAEIVAEQVGRRPK